MEEKKIPNFFQIFSRFWNFRALFIVKQRFLKWTFLKKGWLGFAHIRSTCGPDLPRAFGQGLPRKKVRCVSGLLSTLGKCVNPCRKYVLTSNMYVYLGRTFILSIDMFGLVSESLHFPNVQKRESLTSYERAWRGWRQVWWGFIMCGLRQLALRKWAQSVF